MIVGVQYIVAPMDQQILKVLFMMCGVQQLCISPLGAQFTKMATNDETADMLQTVWNELDFRVDVCRITKGAHIEHL